MVDWPRVREAAVKSYLTMGVIGGLLSLLTGYWTFLFSGLGGVTIFQAFIIVKDSFFTKTGGTIAKKLDKIFAGEGESEC